MTTARKLRIALLVLAALLLVVLLRGSGPVQIEDGSTLVVRLGGQYVEATEAPLIAQLLGENRRPFVGILSTLAKAERDDRIATVVLHIQSLGIGWGKAQELRAAIGSLREAGRKTVAYLEVASLSANRELYIATAADEVYIDPGATVPLVGLAAEYLYLGGLWEKLGIDFEVSRVGRYKSAVETLAGREMSDASREMANSLLDSIEAQFVAGIAEGRGLSESDVRAAIDTGPVLGGQLEDLRIVDGVRSYLAVVEGPGGPVIHQDVYAGVDAADLGFEPEAHVALVYGSGNVVSGKGTISPSGGTVFSSASATDALLQAAKDPLIDAIILRIDSPGGSSLASEVIWQSLKQAKDISGKPIVASFSDVAASGGYYVATAADAIVAPAGTLTGSIGVFSIRPVIGGLLEKLDLRVESLFRGRHADFVQTSVPLSKGARDRMQALAVEIYDLFVQRVADGRSLAPAEVDAVGQGRVWTGAQALDAGLVDELGGLRVAVDRVRSGLGLSEDSDVALVPYPEPPSLAEQLAELLQGRVSVLASLRGRGIELPRVLATLEDWLVDLPLGTPLLIPPLVVEIH